MEIINNRRSVRKYKNQPVEADKIEALAGAAMQAPSAGNQQPWVILNVDDRDLLAKIAEVSPYCGFVKDAPLAVVMMADENRMRFPEYWEQDLAAATQNLLLKAVDLGLGTVWSGIAPLKERMDYLHDLLKLPENMKVFSVVCVGCPASEEANHYVDRYDANRVYRNRI